MPPSPTSSNIVPETIGEGEVSPPAATTTPNDSSFEHEKLEATHTPGGSRRALHSDSEESEPVLENEDVDVLSREIFSLRAWDELTISPNHVNNLCEFIMGMLTAPPHIMNTIVTGGLNSIYKSE
jgi:hypothetical protein